MEDKNPVGRPSGPVDPEKLHEAELVKWVKLNKKVREMIEGQLKLLNDKLNRPEGTGIDEMLTVMDGLGKLLERSSRTIESGFKALEKGSRSGTTNPEDDTEAVYRELEGGR